MEEKKAGMQRHVVSIAGTSFVLAQGHNVEDVQAAVVAAVRAGGDLVKLVVYGNENVSALVSPGVPVIFRSHTVDFEDRDSGDTAFPFTDFDDYALEGRQD